MYSICIFTWTPDLVKLLYMKYLMMSFNCATELCPLKTWSTLQSVLLCKYQFHENHGYKAYDHIFLFN